MQLEHEEAQLDEHPAHPEHDVLHELLHPAQPEHEVAQLDVQPEHALVHVPLHNPLHAPLHDVVEPVIDSAANEFTVESSAASNAAGITLPLVDGVTPSGVFSSTRTSPEMSLTCKSGFIVFSPCSAEIMPPDTGCVVKS